MADPQARGPWPGGIDNISNWRTPAQGSVRDAVNLDPLPGGVMALRSGYEKVVQGVSIRGALSVGQYVLIADGTDLKCLDTSTNTLSVLKTIAGAGRFAGAVWNSELFFCTENETLRFKDGVLRDWGVTTVSVQPVPTLVDGGLAIGEYQCAATFVDAYGDEGGTGLPILVTLASNKALQFTLPTPPVGGKTRLYVGLVQGGTLYLQYEGAGTVVVNQIQDNTARLVTDLLRAPVPADFYAEYNGVILMAEGKNLWMSEPFRPHLRSAGKRFFLYPAPIDGMVSADEGLFLIADKTYLLSDIESAQPGQIERLPHGGVRGSVLKTPDGFGAWMTQYGMAKSDGKGFVRLLSAGRFAPELAIDGRSGIVERNGNQLFVTTMRPSEARNPLSVSDYYEAEIVTP